VEAQEPGADAVGASPASPALPSVSGTLRTRYRARWTGDEDDHDLYETVDLALKAPDGSWSGSVLARAALDLDGRDSGEDAQFFGLLDTYEHRFEPQLFHAYFDVAGDAFELVRFGRQPLYETPLTVLFDGVRAELAPRGERRLRFGAYGGVGEHLYESSSDGDWVLGAFGSMRAWSGAELRLDYMRLEDERLSADHENDLVGVLLDQDLPGEDRRTRVTARFTSLDGNGRDLRLSTSHVDALHGLTLEASLYRLLQTQNQLAAPLDPFSDSLFELFPYTQAGLSAGKDWEHLSVLLGLDIRRVVDASDEGEYNRDFERTFLTATLPDALPVSVSVTGELWDATDTDYETWGASLDRALDGGWNVGLGSYYSLYKVDLVSGEERDHVRTVYLDLRWKRDTARRWNLRYELERNDFDDFHQLRLDYSWSF